MSTPINEQDEIRLLANAYHNIYKKISYGKIRIRKRHKPFSITAPALNDFLEQYLKSGYDGTDQNRMRRLLFRYIARKRPCPTQMDIRTLIEAYAAKEYEDFKEVRVGDTPISDILSLEKENPELLATQPFSQIYRERYVVKQTRNDILALLPLNPIDAYPEARALLRHFIIHVGATNTGKTYQSLQRLKEAHHGVYLSPLRLLALEVQERFLMEDVMCSMSTGEEEDIVPDATIMSCTVEKLHVEEVYDIAVVDECQMIADIDRGYAWTRAILGLMCTEIHLCMAPEALPIICKMIEECNDTYEIHEHTRDTELVFEDEPYDLERDLTPGDALIVFSKKKVLALASHLKAMDRKVSVIYGALPYQSRKEQVRLFLEGQTDVVVATDAIGMGMNLPIRRVVFMETEKFDGVTYRHLEPQEVKQIAGRAGRRGMYDIGYVRSVENCEQVKAMLEQPLPPLPVIQLGVPDNIINLDHRLDDILNTWQSLPTSDVYRRRDVSREVQLYRILHDRVPNLNNYDYYDAITIPFAETPEIQREWLNFCTIFFTKGEDALWFPSRNPKNLDEYETYYKILDLYYQFCNRFELPFEYDLLIETKAEVANHICDILVDNLRLYRRVCRLCGKPLRWDHPFPVCEACYAKQHAIATPEDKSEEEYAEPNEIE